MPKLRQRCRAESGSGASSRWDRCRSLCCGRSGETISPSTFCRTKQKPRSPSLSRHSRDRGHRGCGHRGESTSHPDAGRRRDVGRWQETESTIAARIPRGHGRCRRGSSTRPRRRAASASAIRPASFPANGQQQPHRPSPGVADDEVVEPVDGAVDLSLFLQDPGETLDVLATVGVDSAGGFQVRMDSCISWVRRTVARPGPATCRGCGERGRSPRDRARTAVRSNPRRQVVVPALSTFWLEFTRLANWLWPASSPGFGPGCLATTVAATGRCRPAARSARPAGRPGRSRQTSGADDRCCEHVPHGTGHRRPGQYAGQGDVLVVIGNQ
ncbi:MAG: hypothetical protein CM1200mP2_36740 [Planctomycetaceae bacterium]|nr:MAG: hypothetical protein CM1200mP2_36740 [Planctomycetaceae bacterium]